MHRSAVIITYNEADNIRRCIESLEGLVDEIVVVDGFSTDQTPDLCLDLGVRLFQKEWQGYAATKNYANQLARYDYILSIDADEVISPELRRSILALDNLPMSEVATGYRFARKTNYCGRWVRYSGWYPDKKIRLFDRKRAQWQGDLHETLQFVPNAKIVDLTGDLLHYTIRDLSDHLQRVDRYSNLQAESLRKSGQSITLYHLLIKPAVEFFTVYFLKQGFRDGKAGLFIALISSFAKFMKYAKAVNF